MAEMNVTGSLRKLAKELINIGVEIKEPYELVAKIGGVSFMLNWIADGLDRELVQAQQRAVRQMRETNFFDSTG